MIMQFPVTTISRRRGYHWLVVATVCVGAFMAALDASIINIALPIMKRDFHTHMRIIEWVSLSYILTLAALIVPFSRLSDMFGRRWMYTLGFTVFSVGSLLCGFAPSLFPLFLSRIVQATGAAMLQANSVAIITAAVPSSDQGKAIGIQASAQGLGLSLGPFIGGVLITSLGWKWIFYVNVPVGIIGTLLGVLLLPEDQSESPREKFDIWGAVLLAPTLVAVIYILNAGLQEGWASPVVVTSFLVAVFGTLAFYVTERRVPYPMVDFQLFRNRTFLFGNIMVLFSFAVMYAVMFLAPFFLDNAQKLPPFTAGLYLTAIPIGMTLFTPISGAMVDRVSATIPLVLGMTAAAVGSLLLSLTSVHYSVMGLIIGLFLVGLGMGIFTPPNNSRVMGSVPANRLGITGGTLNMSRTLGMGMGVTLGGLSYQLFLRTQGVVIENKATYIQMIPAFRDSYLVVALIAVAVVALSVVSNRHANKVSVQGIES